MALNVLGDVVEPNLSGVDPRLVGRVISTALAGALALWLSACGTTEPSCDEGYLPADGLCLKVCQANDDCRSEGGLVCDGELCKSPPGAECVKDSDCTAPGACKMPQVTCAAGRCEYQDCTSGYECVDTVCLLRVGLGESCAAGGCKPGLKCENGVCCDATATTCCHTAADCSSALACDLTVASCFTKCTDGESTSCADPVATACMANACVHRVALGGACTQDGQCQSGHCANTGSGGGICCETACAGLCELCGGDGACNQTPADDPECYVGCNETYGSACRAYAEPTASRCAGFGQCEAPSPVVCTLYTDQPWGTTCGAVTGDCDRADYCDGAGGCVDVVKSSGEVCRPAIVAADLTTCDVAEKCDGVAKACPPDQIAAQGQTCRWTSSTEPDGATCDVPESCDGTSVVCPLDGILAAGKQCRALEGACDVPDYCNGSSKSCTDVRQLSTFECRPSGGFCDTPEYCDGGYDCPADAKKPYGTACAHVDCHEDVSCDGARNDCPAASVLPFGTSCATCRQCDATGGCTLMPPSDPACQPYPSLCYPNTCSALGVCTGPAPGGTDCGPGRIGTCNAGLCAGPACRNQCDGAGGCTQCGSGCQTNGDC